MISDCVLSLLLVLYLTLSRLPFPICCSDDCINSSDMFVINRDPLSHVNAFVIENRILFVDSKRKSIFTRMDELVNYDDYKKNKTKYGTHKRKLAIEKSFTMQKQTKDDSNFGFFTDHFLKNEGEKKIFFTNSQRFISLMENERMFEHQAEIGFVDTLSKS